LALKKNKNQKQKQKQKKKQEKGHMHFGSLFRLQTRFAIDLSEIGLYCFGRGANS
jgi:hypothetical protein